MNVIESLVVVNGFVIASGWSDASSISITYKKTMISGQTIYRSNRPDVKNYYQDIRIDCGFQIIASLEGKIIDNSQLEIMCEGNYIRRNHKENDDRSGELFSKFVDIVNSKENSSLIEIGSRARSGNTYLHNFKKISKYTGVDIKEGPNVDIVTDVHTISNNIKGKYDFAFSISVWEHLIMPWVAAYELNKILNVGAVAYIQSHASWPLHEEPWDFFRFSKDAWLGLFNEFTGFEIVDSGYGIQAIIIPVECGSAALEGIEKQKTYLLSSCIIRKTKEPSCQWACDPAKIYNLNYSH